MELSQNSSLNFLKKPFQYGKIQLPSNIFYAPLAGVSNLPYRAVSAQYRPGLLYCEMVKMDALIRYDEETMSMLASSTDTTCVAAQLCGAKVEYAATCAKIIEDFGFTAIDLNCGCPVDKVTKDGSGSALLKAPFKIGAIVEQMVQATSLPVSVKIRAGWDEHSINASTIAQIVEAAGATALCIHGRTRQQGYRGYANRTWIAACRKAVSSLKIIGNGDIFSAQDAYTMFETTGCDAILVARGTMGAPWIAEDIATFLETGRTTVRSLKEHVEAYLEHLAISERFFRPNLALIEAKKAAGWYLRNIPKAKQVRQAIMKGTLPEIKELVNALATDL